MSVALQRKKHLSVKRIALYVFCTFVFVYSMLPNMIVVPISFGQASYLQFPPEVLSLKWYREFFSREEWLRATGITFLVGFAVMILSTLFGTLAAYSLIRGKYPARNMIDFLILTPILVPEIVRAVSVYKFYAGVHLVGSIVGFILADTVVALPFVVLIISAALQGLNIHMEYAGINLGANRLNVLRKIVFPQILPAIVSAGLFSFLVPFDELLIALFISTPIVLTLPKRLWDGIRLEINPTIAAVSTFLILLTIFTLCLTLLVRKTLKKKYNKAV